MAESSQGGGRGGGKRPVPKTFGDVMKGIPSRQGERPSSRGEGRGEGKGERGPGAGSEGGGRGGERRSDGGGSGERRGQRRAEEPKRGPVVVRKPAPLMTAPLAEGTAPGGEGPLARSQAMASPTAGAGAPDFQANEKTKKMVFHRADRPEPAREAAPVLPEIEEYQDESFAELFAASEGLSAPRRFNVGQKVSGLIVKIGQESAFLDLGGKGEATIALAELKDSQGNMLVATGEMLEGYIQSVTGGLVVTRALSKGAQREQLAEARASGIPIEGLVAAQNKGGLEIDLGGGVRAFCPVSQIGLHFVENPGELVGQRLRFRVIELKERDIVLSRRALLEEEAAARAKELRERIAVGVQLEGTVTSLRDYGAFVDLGGIEGLLHVSEISHGRIAHPKEALQQGQRVKVEVTALEPATKEGQHERISLSMKRLEQDPWELAAQQLVEGERRRGRVVRLQPFGAFVELFPGVDGLIHISAFGTGKRITHPRDVVAEGDEVEVAIEGIDLGERRISLRRIDPSESLQPEAREAHAESAGAEATPRPAQAKPAAPQVGAVYNVTVDKVEPFGLFVRFPEGRGLVPNAEMGTHKGADHRKLFPSGSTFKAQLLEIDAQGRLRLSKVAAEQAEERAEYSTFMRGQEKESNKGFGTFADLLKGRFKK